MVNKNSKSIAGKALENLRKRLLDLTGRNRLISFRHTKGASLRIIDELPEQLVETLLSGKKMRFVPVPDPTKEQLVEAGYIEIDNETKQEKVVKKDPDAEQWAKWLNLETSYEVPLPTAGNSQTKHADLAIQTLMYSYEMETRLRGLRQKANTAIEETGTNILYLAFGFLQWQETNQNENPRIAPLYLLPVTLKRGSLNRATGTYEYTIEYTDEDIISNLSLREKLRADFSLALPDLDENTKPEDYFSKVEELINENQPRWRIRRYITLTLLNFSKLLMYLDLDPNRWPEGAAITKHSVVKRFLEGYSSEDAETEKEPDLNFGEEYAIDELPEINQRYPLIDDADSSQHSALIDALDGNNLVIEGPPGTGKSQTITNIIAGAISQGKKVLFVAEKLAALEVVKRRLDAVGLGEFCLELHSHKTQKRKVFEEIGNRLNSYGTHRKPSAIGVDIRRYEELVFELKSHVEIINRGWKNTGKTIHEILMGATRHRESIGLSPHLFKPIGCDGRNYDPLSQRRLRDQVGAFKEIVNALLDQTEDKINIGNHAWCGVENKEIQLYDKENVVGALAAWQETLEQLSRIELRVANICNVTADSAAAPIVYLEKLSIELSKIPVLQGDELLEAIPLLRQEALNEFIKYLELYKTIQEKVREIGKLVTKETLTDLPDLYNTRKAKESINKWMADDAEYRIVRDAEKIISRVERNILALENTAQSIEAALGSQSDALFPMSSKGLSELGTFVSAVSMLEPGLWKQRSDYFDNDELDEVLPKLRGQIDHARSLNREIKGTYSVSELPRKADLSHIQTVMQKAGIFRWLSSEWRKANRTLETCVAGPSVNRKSQIALLDKAVDYAATKERVENSRKYRNCLGENLRGVNTNIKAIEALRNWYRHVRQEYGVGLGPKVAMGNTIIGMSNDLARGIHSLLKQNFLSQVEKGIGGVNELRKIFRLDSELFDPERLLHGDEGLLREVGSIIEEINSGIAPLVKNGNPSIGDIKSRIDELIDLGERIESFVDLDLDNKIFEGKLGLNYAEDEGWHDKLDVGQRTAYLANVVQREINNHEIREKISKSPNERTFQRFHEVGKELASELQRQSAAFNEFSEITKLSEPLWFGKNGKRVDAVLERNQFAIKNPDALSNWLDYLRIKADLASLGLDSIPQAVENGQISASQIDDAYLAGIYDVLAREVFDEVPEVARFSGQKQEALQKQFCEYDEKLKRLQCEKISWLVDQNRIPQGRSGARVKDYTEWKLLKHECSKKTRHVPIRRVVERAGNALVKLKPCFMMGPMSVAQYLTPGIIEFDLVVMDEASQIKPEDAIGTIARGGQLVVVGDPKQLPPTSFFDRMIDEENDDATAIEESESILDTTLSIFPARRLRWHYRSQHESLIAFSNQSFYGSDLVLFPSPYHKSDGYGVHLSPVPRGTFVNRRNMEEAKVIAKAVREHFRHRAHETLGIVTMNSQQRDQIERNVEMLAKEDLAFQQWLENDQSRHESLFFKNLENVQGDERDVIYISMTYGPQEVGGKVMQRFGPINTDVGWRRLNVLFTRARKRMQIFSSMKANDIVVSVKSSLGVKALHDFLAFVETGILHHTEGASGRAPDSDFEIAVMQVLRNHGFECEPQIGVAGFFIDIGVKDPGNPGRYLMGVECDGATYHSAKSVRDRDRLRQIILERLGWRIRRIWSTDWFKNPGSVIQPIVEELLALKTIPVSEDLEETEVEEIEEILEQEELLDASVDRYISEGKSLQEKLLDFDREVIRREAVSTPENERILRPAMLEAFLEYTPTSKSEFLEYMPPYLRQSTAAPEGNFLEQILEIIDASLETEQ